MWKMILIEIVGVWSVLYIAALTAPWFIYIAILVILFGVLVVVGGNRGIKGVGVSILVYIVSLVGFNYFYNYTCGDNSADVKVMKPMAQKISDYIVKNGIPESLKDIPDLPYGLEGCEREQENLEQCIFHKNNKEYEAEIYILGNMDITIRCRKSKTGLRYELENNTTSNQWTILEKDIAYSGKSSGICDPMNQ